MRFPRKSICLNVAISVALVMGTVRCGGGSSNQSPTGPGTTTTTTNPPPTLTAKFTVTSNGTADVCPLKADTTLDCVFDGSQSTGSVKTYLWTQVLATKTIDTPTTAPTLNPTTNGCGLFSGQKSSQVIQMEVHLKVQDAAGNVSAEAVDKNVVIKPLGTTCGL
jgi:hypothetical protein